MSKFCALKSAGMGNRFKIYVSYLARYDEVLVEKNEDRFIFTNFNPCNKDEDIKQYPWTGSGWRLLVDENEEQYIKKYKTIDQLYNDTPQYFIDKYVPYWQSLNINPEIRKSVDAFTKDWDKENMIGIHIRTNYPPVDDGTRSVWVDFEGFEREVQMYSPSQKFFLASDHEPIIDYYKNKYPNQIITYPKQDIVRHDSVDNIQQSVDSFMDMYLLSQCYKKLILTFGTTFSECSWWFGECKAKVVMPTFWDKVPKDFYNNVYNLKNTMYNLSGEEIAAEGCRTYAPLNVGKNYKIKDWKVIYE
tara:strand:- start:733 stop:1641 length:909 start_codon:yes stop_codon:yes gene_type:complete